MRNNICAMVASAAALALVPVASADQIALSFDIDQSANGFSVLHEPTNDAGGGDVLWRLTGSFNAIFDDVAETLEIVGFNAQIRANDEAMTVLGELNLTHSSSLLDLTVRNSEEYYVGADADDQSGNGVLALTLVDTSGMIADKYEGQREFLFLARRYNSLANRFNTTINRLGLWGATSEVFGGDGHLGQTGIDEGSLGLDLLGNGGPVIPLPTPALLAGVGLAGVAGLRRRR